MKFLFFLLLSLPAFAEPPVDSFVIQIQDRSVNVHAPEKSKTKFSVIIENRSLADQMGKFTVGGKLLRFVSISSGKTEVVALENKSSIPVVFVPVSPAFQDIELHFGKKAYEIPPKE